MGWRAVLPSLVGNGRCFHFVRFLFRFPAVLSLGFAWGDDLFAFFR